LAGALFMPFPAAAALRLAAIAVPPSARAQTGAPVACEGSSGIAWYAGSGFYESNPTYTVPTAQEGTWQTSTPQAQGMNSQTLQAGINWLDQNYPNLLSVLVVRNGRLVEEQYFHGGAANHANNIHSASKSMLQALIGIAIAKGYIGSVNDKVSRYLPQYFTGAPPSEQSITIKDMLSMSSGLKWTEDSTEYRIQSQPNWVQAILSKPMAATPGTTFNYSTGNFHVLSAMLTAAIDKATGTSMSTCDFAEQYLFSPIGIVPAHWGADPTTGVDMGGCDLYMTPRDMALFGQLYLNNGAANGQQVVPAATVAQSRQAIFNDGGGFYYSQGWWTRTLSGVPMSLAWGYNGQFIYVIPSLNIVLVTTENTQDGTGPFKEVNSGDFIKNYLLPSITG
jgi:CubicO group peptidase (beta-lactamase class C family)